MASTGYIVWDSKEHRIISGPFATSAEATTFLNRSSKHVDSAHTAKTSKNPSSLFTVESVTLA